MDEAAGLLSPEGGGASGSGDTRCSQTDMTDLWSGTFAAGFVGKRDSGWLAQDQANSSQTRDSLRAEAEVQGHGELSALSAGFGESLGLVFQSHRT